jgi:O-antigen/teichoic acid export membrane protein
MLIISLTGYYGLLDIGIRSAVSQYLTRHWAKGDIDRVNRTMNTALVLLSGIGAVVIIISIPLAYILPAWIEIRGISPTLAQWAMLIIGFGIGAGFPMVIFGTAPIARQRYDIANAVSIIERLASAGIIVWVLRSGYGLLGLAIVGTGFRIVGHIARVIVAYLLLPGLRITPRLFSRESLRELGRYSFFSFLRHISERIILYTDAIIIAIFMTTSAVTYYAIGGNFIPYYGAIIASITLTFTPYATSCDAKNDRNALRQLLKVGTRYTMLLASLIGGGLIFLGHDFIKLWMGEKYVSGELYASSAIILSILATDCLIRLSQSCGRQILFGMRRVGFLALLTAWEATGNLVLSLLLIKPFGLIGVALGTLLPALVTQAVVMPLFLCRLLGIKVSKYLREFFPVSGAVIITIALLSWLVHKFIVAESWSLFFITVAIVGIPAAIVGVLCGTTQEEKASAIAWIGLKTGFNVFRGEKK